MSLQAPRSLREELELFEREGELRRMLDPVDLRFELARLTKRHGGSSASPALLFEQVTGSPLRVAVGCGGSRRRVALGLGTSPLGIVERCEAAIARPVPPKLQPSGPVKEIRLAAGDFDLRALLPVPVHYEGDAGPYITCGSIVARDVATGIQNLSIHRMLLTGPNTLVALIQERQLYQILKRAEEAGRPLEVAVVLGLPTAIRTGAASAWDTGSMRVDEFEYAGALQGAPVALVECETANLHVPADAEIVLEGTVSPGDLAPEGPMAEFNGLYGDASEQPVLRIRCVTHRQQAIFQDILPASPEHHLMLALPWEPVLRQNIARLVPGTRGVQITSGSCGEFHCIISLAKEDDGDPVNAMLAAFATNRNIKQAIVVDDDIDIFSPEDVEYAMSTRMQADRDMLVIRGARGNPWDPMMKVYGYVTKVGFDATKPSSHRALFERARIPDGPAKSPR